jgi:hypothetical protein
LSHSRRHQQHPREVAGLAGATGIDAITRIVGFFVAAMGIALIFYGVIEGLQTNGLTTLH